MKSYTLFALVLLAILPAQTFAASKAKPYKPVFRESPETPDGITLGIEAYDYHYKEPNFAYLDGPFVGLDLTLTHKFGNSKKYFVTLNASGDIGDLDYSSNGSGSDSGIKNYKGDIRGLLGRDFLVGKKFAISPYTGLGYRILYDNSSNTETDLGFSGYDRTSQYVYLPVGLSLGYTIGNWTLRPNAEYDYLIHGHQTSSFTDFGFDEDLENSQNSGYGLRASLMLETPTSIGILSFGPFVRYWHIDDSDVAFSSNSSTGEEVAGIEPANRTTEIGGKINLRF